MLFKSVKNHLFPWTYLSDSLCDTTVAVTNNTFCQLGRRQWAVHLHWSQKFINNVFLFIGSLNNFKQLWGLYWTLIGWLIKLSVQAFQSLIIIYRRGNFMYLHRECTSTYRPLSYPFGSIHITESNKRQ